MRWTIEGQERTATFSPSEFAVPRLAASLADAWKSVAESLGSPMHELRRALVAFVEDVEQQPGVARELDDFDLTDVRRRHLDAWEGRLLASLQSGISDVPYRKAVGVFALLRHISETAPTLLHEEVHKRLEQPTRLWHRRQPGGEPFTPDELRSIQVRARSIIRSYASPPAATEGPPYRLLQALHILISIESGEPPEVVRALCLDDLVVTSTPEGDTATEHMGPHNRLAWLVEHDLIASIYVRWRKERAHVEYRSSVTSKQFGLFNLLLVLLRVTAPARKAGATSVSLWITTNSRGAGVRASFTGKNTLKVWLETERISIVGSARYDRFRKTVTGNEAAAAPAKYFVGRRRHGPETFYNHYTNNSLLRAHAGQLLLDAAGDLFERAVAGPTVVPPQDERKLNKGRSVEDVSPAVGHALVGGELEGPHTACRDPKSSPYAASGTLCQLSMTGTCFGCTNALIRERNLPAVLVIAELAEPDQAGDPRVWRERWKFIWDAIQHDILPKFSADSIRAARARMSQVPLDIGLRNDLRGLDDAD